MQIVQTTRVVLPATVPDPLGGRNVSDCIGLYPKPGCGTEAVLSGDRGGSMQYATFGIMITALIVIGVRMRAASQCVIVHVTKHWGSTTSFAVCQQARMSQKTKAF